MVRSRTLEEVATLSRVCTLHGGGGPGDWDGTHEIKPMSPAYSEMRPDRALGDLYVRNARPWVVSFPISR